MNQVLILIILALKYESKCDLFCYGVMTHDSHNTRYLRSSRQKHKGDSELCLTSSRLGCPFSSRSLATGSVIERHGRIL